MLPATQDRHPPGPLFVVFAFGACVSGPHTVGDVFPAVVVAGLSGLFALAVGASGLAVHRFHQPPARVAWRRSWLPARDAVAVAVARLLATAMGHRSPVLGHGRGCRARRGGSADNVNL